MDFKNKSRFGKHVLYRKRMYFLALLLILCMLSVLIFYCYISSVKSKPKDLNDDPPEEIYQNILSKYYEFSKNGNKWYNKENISQKDKELVREVRENWIFEKPKELDYSLKFPELNDPSMGQAKVIREIFNNARNGFFIECGAYDGETRSNTLNLERYYGWTGILIEADPINFAKMSLKHRNAYLSPTCLSITPYPKILSFLMADNIGRLHEENKITDEELKNSPDVAHVGKHIDVQCFPLATYIFALNRTSIDYFSLDIEGNEIDVLQTIPFNLVDIKTLSVEFIHNSESKEYMIDLMKENGYYVYSYVKHDNNLANDIIFVKETFLPSAKIKSNLDLNLT